MKKYKDWILSLLSLMMIVVLIYAARFAYDSDQPRVNLYVCIGAIAIFIGILTSKALKSFALSKDANLQKQLSIEENDERNIYIANMAKAKAFDLMNLIFMGLIIVFSIMNVDLTVIKLMIISIITVNTYGLIVSEKLRKSY